MTETEQHESLAEPKRLMAELTKAGIKAGEACQRASADLARASAKFNRRVQANRRG